MTQRIDPDERPDVRRPDAPYDIFGTGGDWPRTPLQRLVLAIVVIVLVAGFLWVMDNYSADKGRVFSPGVTQSGITTPTP